MRFITYVKVILLVLALSLAGCGGGGGGGGGEDSVAPTINVFTMPATSDSLTSTTVDITLRASDSVGVTGYLVTESATPPSANASGWSPTAPTNFTFTSAGVKSAYAWAKDAAGNVSSSRSVSVTFTELKTATLKFSSQNTSPNDSIAGFRLSVKLPLGSFMPTDSLGGPLPGVVVFAGTNFIADDFFNSSTLNLMSLYAFTAMKASDFFDLGDFITILVTVPIGYPPNEADIINNYSFTAKSPSGSDLDTVTATPTFN